MKYQFAYFPLVHNTKIPAFEGGCTKTTFDTAILDEWKGNIGIEAQASNLILIDLDKKGGRDGIANWHSLEENYGKTPTLAVSTPSGGIHLYYRRPADFDKLKLPNIKDTIGAGIEVRHTNQYLVAPPSKIDGLSYKWIDETAAISDCPQWLIDLMRETLVEVKTGWADLQTPNGYVFTANDVIEKFNQLNPIESILQKYGYTSGKHSYMLYPGERSPSVHLLGDRSYHFGAGDPLKGKGVGVDSCCCFPYHVAVHFEYGGDSKEAIKAFSKSLGMDGRKKQKTETPINTTTNVVWMDEVDEKTISWLWQDRIPFGCLSLLAGPGGVNKSTIMYTLAARLSKGEKLPLSERTIQGKTLIVSGEDDPQTVIRPRLRIAGADLSSVGILDIRETVNGERKKKRFALTDLSGLEAALKSCDNIKMVVIDPVGSFGGKANGDKQFDVMEITSSLNELAAKHNIAIVACHHLNKSAAGGSRGLRDRLMGSAGWYDGSRAVFLATKDKTNPDRRQLSHGKGNHAKLQDAIGFEVIVHKEGDNQIISLKWDIETTSGTADEFLIESALRGEDVETWLRDQLEGKGEVNANMLIEEGQKRGIDKNRLWRATDKLGVKKRKEGFANTGVWFWSLPPDERQF